MDPIIPRQNLDPALWEIADRSNPKLTPQARTQVLSGIARIMSLCPTEYAVIFGKCLVSADKQSRVNVLVGLNKKHVNKLNIRSLNMIIDQLNDKYVLGTQHPINFILTTEEYDKNKFDQLYAPIDEKWLRYIITDQYNKPQISTVFEKKNDEDDNHLLVFSKVPFNAAKAAEFGIWPISIGQAEELCTYFSTKLPDRNNYMKKLGNTKIVLYRPKRDKFYLMKGDALAKTAKRKIMAHKFKQGSI